VPIANPYFAFLPYANYDDNNRITLVAITHENGIWGTQEMLVPLNVRIWEHDYSAVSGKMLITDSDNSIGSGPSNLTATALNLYDPISEELSPLFAQNIVRAKWLPNGVDFAYILATATTYELRVRFADGTDTLFADDVPHSFTVSPQGDTLAFTRESRYAGLSKAAGLYVVDLTTGVERQISDYDRQGFGGTGEAWLPQWSPDGKSVILNVSGMGMDAVVWAGRDGSFSHHLSHSQFEQAIETFLPESNICPLFDLVSFQGEYMVGTGFTCPTESVGEAGFGPDTSILYQLNAEGGVIVGAWEMPAFIPPYGWQKWQNETLVFADNELGVHTITTDDIIHSVTADLDSVRFDRVALSDGTIVLHRLGE
jgi:hypothetical protein